MGRTEYAITLAILLLAASCHAQAQSTPSPGEFTFTDGKGDPAPFGAPINGGAANQGTPVTDHIDLVSFRMFGEDMEGLYLEFGVVNVKPQPQVPVQTGGYASFEAQFKLDGVQIQYYLRMQITSQMAQTPTGQAPMPTSFCVSETGSRFGSCSNQRVFGTLDWDKSLMTIYVTKQALMGQDPVGSAKTPNNPPRLDVGSRLTDIRATSFGGPFGGYFLADYMPDQGARGPYVMQSKAANDRLRLRLNDMGEEHGASDPFPFGMSIQDFPKAAVSPGTTTLVQISVENLNAGKRLINLSTEFVEDKDANKWEARIVPTITVPGEDRRVVNLIVNLTGNVEHRESALLRITARSLGFADEIGVMKVRLIAAVPPSPKHKDLFFHASTSNSMLCFGCGAPTWLNTLEQDPKATSDSRTPFTGYSSSTLNGVTYSRTFLLDAPLNEDLVIDPRDPIAVVLNFYSQLPASGTAKLELSAGDIFIGAGEAPWTGSGPVQFSIQPALEAERLPAGSEIFARVGLAVGQPSAGIIIGMPETRPEFVPKGSKFTLPVIQDPKPRVKNAPPAGPAFLTLELEGDAEEFVNPGKVKVFRLTIINEGVQEDVVQLQATKDPENWYVDIKPSDSFRLKPGDSARFGVLVKPPSGAKEGEQAVVTLNATSKADATAIVQATLTAIVTTGVEIEDEADNFTADEDTVSHVEEAPKQKSPGIGAAGIAVAAVASLLLIRRRRRDKVF